ncbi:unnamed protein product, partial [Medioppia subpectinata]
MFSLSHGLSQQLVRTVGRLRSHHLKHKWHAFVITNRWPPKPCLELSSVALMATDPSPKPRVAYKPIDTHITANVAKELPNDYNKVWTFPNILCMTRIAFTPVIGYLVIGQHFTTALTLCAIGSVTDLLDGYYARKYNCVTKLG